MYFSSQIMEEILFVITFCKIMLSHSVSNQPMTTGDTLRKILKNSQIFLDQIS